MGLFLGLRRRDTNKVELCRLSKGGGVVESASSRRSDKKGQDPTASGRRGGVVFNRATAETPNCDSSGSITWTTNPLPEPKKAALKVLTLEDSLASCRDREMPRRRSRSTRQQRRSTGGRNGGLLGTFARALSGKGHHMLHEMDSPSQRDTMTTSHKCQVQFDSLKCRLYELVPEVNPSTTAGASVGIGWNYREGATLPVDEFESNRPPRRKMEDFKLTAVERERRLRASGATEKQLRIATRNIAIARRRRRETLEAANSLQYDRSMEKMENLMHRIKFALGLKKPEEEEQDELWDRAQQQ